MIVFKHNHNLNSLSKNIEDCGNVLDKAKHTCREAG